METLRGVIGSELPFERVDVRGFFATGVAALLPAIACLLGGRSPWILLASAGPFLVLVALMLITNYRGAHPSKPCPAAKRREYRVGVPIEILSIPLIFGFRYWAISSGAPSAVANACILLFLGMILLFQGLYEVGRRPILCVAVPTIVCGLAWPHVEYFLFWTILWMSVGGGTIAAATLMWCQLRSLPSAEE